MGLCKCPKRKVTNLFCFEHRVNVCEWCLVASHESCVVQTYLSWLTDSDFDANCPLCADPLAAKETVRLKCLHLFHWECLNAREEQLPPNTAPAGYKCPSCLDVLFPAEKQTSPVVDRLKEKLKTAAWAQGGLSGGFEPLDSSVTSLSNPSHQPLKKDGVINHHGHQPNTHTLQKSMDPFQLTNSSAALYRSKSTSHGDGHPHQQYPSNTTAYYNGPATQVNNSLVAIPVMRGAVEGDMDGLSLMDESKYVKRGGDRSGLRHRWARLPRSVKRIVLGLLACVLIYFLLSALFNGSEHETTMGRPQGAEDAMFDPHANPNIRTE